VAFIHVDGALVDYAWHLRAPTAAEVLLKVASLLYLAWTDPRTKPVVKSHNDVLVAAAVFKSMYPMSHVNQNKRVYFGLIVWALGALLVHTHKLVGDHSSWVMHLMLAFPKYFILRSIADL